MAVVLIGRRALGRPPSSVTSVAAMRRVLFAVLVAVVLAACTDEGSPTVEPAPSTSERASTTTLEPGGTPTSDTAAAPAGTTVKLTGDAVVGRGDPDGS